MPLHPITVRNRHHLKPEDEKGEYVGRGSPLGNPWAITPTRSRAECIEIYEVYLRRNLEVEDPDIMREMVRLYEIAQQRPLFLDCYCAPQACHGEIIKKALLSCDEGEDP
jgi:hypothetical protein